MVECMIVHRCLGYYWLAKILNWVSYSQISSSHKLVTVQISILLSRWGPVSLEILINFRGRSNSNKVQWIVLNNGIRRGCTGVKHIPWVCQKGINKMEGRKEREREGEGEVTQVGDEQGLGVILFSLQFWTFAQAFHYLAPQFLSYAHLSHLHNHTSLEKFLHIAQGYWFVSTGTGGPTCMLKSSIQNDFWNETNHYTDGMCFCIHNF